MEKVVIVSLGCNKNLVDSEVMAGYLTKAGYSVNEDPAKADVIIVNTCGFIEDAKVEAIDTIFEMAQYKQSTCKALLVSGCLSQRYPEEICAMEEVDGVLGTYEYENIAQIVKNSLEGKKQIYIGSTAHYLDKFVKKTSKNI